MIWPDSIPTEMHAWGNPLIVVQPEGSALLYDGGQWSAGQPLIDEYSFIYRYDDRLRPVSAKIPGCAPELTAYDSRGLVAYTRDGRLAATGRKMFHLYDAHCRPAVSGICDDFLSDSDWGSVHDTPVAERTVLSSGVASDYNFSPSSLPAAAQVTQLWYYDRYLPGMAYAHGMQSPLGMPTAERTLVLDGWKAADTVTVEHHYDSMMQEMFTRRRHSDGTMLLCTTTRTPGGLPLVESIALSGPLGIHSLVTYTEYDAFGRITSLKANSDRSVVLTLALNSYDGVGRLASSTVHGGSETTYGYNVRGALTSADNPFIKQSWKYASGSLNPSYAGRISGKTVEYHDNGGSCSGSVTYRYDSMGRLKSTVAKRDILWKMDPPVVNPPIWKAGALELDTTVAKPWNPGTVELKKRDYSESFTYDLNSNILSLTRMGHGSTGQYATVDDLTMGYTGNRLTSLTDNADEVTLESSMDIPSGQFLGRDFGYDAAGAVTRDVSRNISNIEYYFNGMPKMVGTMGSDCVSYVYTADGEKLAETVWNGNRTTRRDYIGPFEFIGGQLLRINLPQGYIDSIGTLHAYIPDIQGNIVGVHEARDGNTELEQLNEYYAYGGLTADSDGQDANRRKHTAKELTTDFGINTYDFTARSQYPMASRFDQPDKKSGDYKWLSPYIFCAADPINFSDPTGMDIYRFDKKTGDVVLFKKTDDEFDQIGEFKKNKDTGDYELRTNRKGEAKTLVDKIEKGILRDGMNLKEQDNVWQVGGDGKLSVEGFQEFAIELSELLDLELGGYYFSKQGSEDIEYVGLGKYKNNRYDYCKTAINIKEKPWLHTDYRYHTNWHTHPSRARTMGRFLPSKPDQRIRDQEKKAGLVLYHIILTKGYPPIRY